MSYRLVCGDKEFVNKQIKSVKETNDRDLLGASLAVDTLTVVVQTDDESITQYTINALVKLYDDGIHRCTMYLSSIERVGEDSYQINAVSAINALANQKNYGGIWLDTPITVGALVDYICGDVPHVVQTVYASREMRGWLPIASSRDNLMQLLFAIGATATCDLNGAIRIESIWTGFVGNIDIADMYSGSKMQYEQTVSSVSLTIHYWDESDEEIQLFNGEVPNDTIIEFSEPVHTLRWGDGTTFTIIDSGANYAKISGGIGTLYGKKYIHNTRVLTKTVNDESQINEKIVDNATLITADNALPVLNRLFGYYSCRNSVNGGVVYEGLKPANRVCVYKPYRGVVSDAYIESANQSYSATTKSDVKALTGFVPLRYAGAYTRIFVHKILTGSDVLELPPNIEDNSINVVLIGGGESGAKGEDGESTAGQSADGVPQSLERTWEPTSGGAGGVGGAAGDGGKIRIIDNLDVSGVSAIPFNAGKGGKASSTATKNAGTDTTFGPINGATYRSSSGQSSAYGYHDTYDGKTYALSGQAGVDGGDGGAGGTASAGTYTNGANGEDVGTHSGGSGARGGTINENYVTGQTLSRAIVIGGFGGGGASADGDGKNAKATTYNIRYRADDGVVNDYYDLTITNDCVNGADAKNAASKADSDVYGTGGDGGNGGGGAGGMCGFYKPEFSSGYGDRLSTYFTVPKAKGGKGGKGGAAANGCIIVTYTLLVPKDAGASYDTIIGKTQDDTAHASHRFRIDKYGRILVV